MGFVIAADVPQSILDAFNKVDFKQVSKITKIAVINVLKGWANTNLKQKDKKKTYPKTIEKKRITADFDKDLLEIINKYDYVLCSQDKINNMVAQINSYVGNLLPAK